MIQLEQRDDLDPICPFCQETVRTLAYRALSGMFGKRYVYFCVQCGSVLGISHRKGFWMG